MSGDIRALTPLSSMPLVREKRHYHGEQKKDQYKKKQQHGSTNNQERVDDPAIANIPDSDVSDPELSSKPELTELEEQQKKNVDHDGKNVRVMHVDEYA